MLRDVEKNRRTEQRAPPMFGQGMVFHFGYAFRIRVYDVPEISFLRA